MVFCRERTAENVFVSSMCLATNLCGFTNLKFEGAPKRRGFSHYKMIPALYDGGRSRSVEIYFVLRGSAAGTQGGTRISPAEFCPGKTAENRHSVF